MVLTDEQRSLRDAARRYARERLLPGLPAARARRAGFDRALVREMGALGLICPDLPPELGGLGVDSVTAGLIVEELAYGDFNIGSLVVVAALLGAIIARDAPPELARRWVPAIVRGDAIVALAITEPHARIGRGASSVAGGVVSAKPRATHFLLSGEKELGDLLRHRRRLPRLRAYRHGGRTAHGASRRCSFRPTARASGPPASTTWAVSRSAAARCSSTMCGSRWITASAPWARASRR